MNGEEANFFEIKSNEIEIEITDFKQFVGACMTGRGGASLELLHPNIDAITDYAKEKKCVIGARVFPGCEVVGFDHGDLL